MTPHLELAPRQTDESIDALGDDRRQLEGQLDAFRLQADSDGLRRQRSAELGQRQGFTKIDLVR